MIRLSTLLGCIAGAVVVVFVAVLVFRHATSSTSKSLSYQNVPYCNTDRPSQTLDAYLPDRGSAVPVVLYVHGGGWKEGDKQDSIQQEYANLLNEKGVAFVSIDYRLSYEAVYPAQNEDVRCAVNFIRSGSHGWPVDSTNLIIMGDSAGGQLAALEALQRKHLYDGVIMAYGVSNLWEQIKEYHDTNASSYLGEVREDLADEASPVSVDLANAPDFLILHGTSDSVVPSSESKQFAETLRKSRVKVVYEPIQGAQHAFLGSGSVYDKQAWPYIEAFVLNR